MRCTLLLALSILFAGYVPAENEVIRLCVSAGQLFPETEEGLRSTVVRLLDEAEAKVPTEPLYACVVPHGPYGISGKVAAAAFKYLQPGQFTRVIVLGASHAGVDFEDCSIAAVDAYATPMGFVPLDKVAVRTLTYSTLFATRSLRYNHAKSGFLSESERKPLHEYEHSIELILPFLQERLGKFELVPVLVGKLTNGTGQFSEKRAEAVAMQLRRIMDSKTLLVVSTDFTHFGNDFGFRPFGTDVFNKIEKLDNAGLSRLAANDFEEFESFVRSTKVPICGMDALRVLEKLLPANAHGELMARDTSGRFYNDENRSVSYASMNFYLSERPRPSLAPTPIDITRLEAPPNAEADPSGGQTSDPTTHVPRGVTEYDPLAKPAPRDPDVKSEAPRIEAPADSSGPVTLTNMRRGSRE